MDITISASDVIAGAALALSAYATIKTLRFNERQKSLIESQERLNQLLLQKEEDDAISATKAYLGANFVKMGNNNLRLKVFNKGKATAHNVRIEFPDGNEVVILSDVESKFPLEVLEQHQSVELIASVAMGSKSKHHVKLTWDDVSGTDHSKSLYPTI